MLEEMHRQLKKTLNILLNSNYLFCVNFNISLAYWVLSLEKVGSVAVRLECLTLIAVTQVRLRYHCNIVAAVASFRKNYGNWKFWMLWLLEKAECSSQQAFQYVKANKQQNYFKHLVSAEWHKNILKTWSKKTKQGRKDKRKCEVKSSNENQ